MRRVACRIRGSAIAILATAALLSYGTALGEPASPKAELATKLLQQIDTRQAIETWRRMLLNPSALPNCGCDRSRQVKVEAAWQAAVRNAFDVEEAYSVIWRDVAASFTEAELTEMVRFRDTPLGRKLSELERPPANEADDRALLGEMADVQVALAADKRRKKLLEEIVEAIGGVEAHLDLIANISLGSALGAQAAQPQGQPRRMPDEIIATIEETRSTLRQVLKPLVLHHAAAIYKSLTRRELKTYRDALVSDVGRRFVRVGLGAFNKAMRAQALAIGARFSKELNAQSI